MTRKKEDEQEIKDMLKMLIAFTKKQEAFNQKQEAFNQKQEVFNEEAKISFNALEGFARDQVAFNERIENKVQQIDRKVDRNYDLLEKSQTKIENDFDFRIKNNQIYTDKRINEHEEKCHPDLAY